MALTDDQDSMRLDATARQKGARKAKQRIVGQVARIGYYTLRDRTFRPVPTSIDDVPWAPESVTDEWLTRALCASHPGARVDTVDRGESTKGSSTRCTATLTYNEAGRAAGLPERVFIKGSKTLKTRLLLGLLDLMSSETRFFHQIRPELDLECPEGYFGSFDPRTWRHCIVMEDIVATKGAEFCRPVEPLGRDEISGMLSTLATYHGTFWASPRFDLDLSWVKQARTAKTFVENLTHFVNLEHAATNGVAKYPHLVPERLVRERDKLSPALWRSLEYAVSGPQTLIHGDCHLGNFYRTDDGTMGIFDWQTCGVGSWAFDVSYLMSAALTIEDRRAWERELLEFYLDELRRSGLDAPSFDEGFDAYRRGLMYPLFAWLFALNKSPLQPQMQPKDTCIELSRRISTAVDDLQVLDLLS